MRVGERTTSQEPEHQECTTGSTPVVVQRHDVRMLDPRHELCFGLEPLDEARVVGQFGPHDLDCDLTADAGLHGAVHRAERALDR